MPQTFLDERPSQPFCKLIQHPLPSPLSLSFHHGVSEIIPRETKCVLRGYNPGRFTLTGRVAKRLKGCVFLPPSLLPVPGRLKEARKHNLSIAFNPISVCTFVVQIRDENRHLPLCGGWPLRRDTILRFVQFHSDLLLGLSCILSQTELKHTVG